MSSDLSLEKHVSAVCAACFFHLRQIRRVRQSLDAGSAASFIHAFVTSRVDNCNAVLAGQLRVTTDKLQRVMNSAACVISNTRKFDGGLSWLLHDELHWLDVTHSVLIEVRIMKQRLEKVLSFFQSCRTINFFNRVNRAINYFNCALTR